MLNSQPLKWFLIATLFFLAASAGVTSVLIVERQETLDKVSRYNLTWLMSQGASETLRLLEAVSASAVPGTSVTQEDVDLRYSVLINRLNLLRVGEAAEFIRSRPELVATVAELDRTLAALPPLIDALPAPSAVIALRVRLDPLVPRMLQLAAASNTRSGELVAADQSDLSELHWTLAKLMFALIVCAVLLVCIIQLISARMLRNLQYTKQVADAANAAKSQFLANVSHELRTPLNGLLGTIELLLHSNPTPQQRRYAETAQTTGRILFEMITEILHFAKIESGEIELDLQPVDMRALASEVADILRPEVQEKNLVLSLRIAAEFPAAVRVDEARLRQILLNLVGNAVKYTPAGAVELAITADAASSGQCRVRICVTDTGIGIPADKIDRIFDPFIQADLSNTRRFGGVGLGLSIVSNLVKRMDGQIEVQSREGEGAQFIVTLPLAIAERAPADQLAAPPPGAATPEETHRSPGRPIVLLVDDVGTSREVVRSFLQRAGCSVDLAENGHEAVQRCAETAYDIIFMDRHMPVMDGIEATQRIRAQSESSNSRSLIVGLSAGALDEERENCLAAGMDDYLTKPVRMARIVAKIDAWRCTTAAVDGTRSALRADDSSVHGRESSFCEQKEAKKLLPLQPDNASHADRFIGTASLANG